ncbi:MAG: hypothetical protein ACRCST_17935 [Turicibacter sp.]
MRALLNGFVAYNEARKIRNAERLFEEITEKCNQELDFFIRTMRY